MALRLLGHIELPPHRSNGGFDHADIHSPHGPAPRRAYQQRFHRRDRLARDHTLNRCLASRQWQVRSCLKRAGLVFTTNRGENTVSVFAPGAERNAFKIAVGVKPNGLAFDSARGILIAANVGDPSIPDSHSVSVVDLERRERIAEVKVPGRTRWTIYDAAREMFFVNIASPARIVAIDARDPTRISKEYEVPAAWTARTGPRSGQGSVIVRLRCRRIARDRRSVWSRARGCSPERRPGRDFPASAIRASLRGHRRSRGHRRHRYWHDAPRGGGADRSRRTHAGTRPEEEQSLFVPAPIASRRGICRYDLIAAPSPGSHGIEVARFPTLHDGTQRSEGAVS